MRPFGKEQLLPTLT